MGFPVENRGFVPTNPPLVPGGHPSFRHSSVTLVHEHFLSFVGGGDLLFARASPSTHPQIKDQAEPDRIPTFVGQLFPLRANKCRNNPVSLIAVGAQSMFIGFYVTLQRGVFTAK